MDLVYCWVNGHDPQLAAVRKSWEAKFDIAPNTETRDVDAGELRYSLRSYEKYNRLFERVIIVHDDLQKPDWLNEDCPQLRLVKHSDFIPAEYLPTFCSCVIESFLHRIDGLSEVFVYANDDFFFSADIVEDSFVAGNKLYFHVNEFDSFTGPIVDSDCGWTVSLKNANRLLDQLHQAPRKILRHFPYVSSKAACDECWGLFAEELSSSAASKFRTGQTVAFINHLVPYYLIHRDRAVARFKEYFIPPQLSSSLHRRLRLGLKMLLEITAAREQKFFCCNEGEPALIRRYLDKRFPDKSCFER